MADGGNFDPCECISLLNQEARMQRLISMLRESQSYCTDSECFDEGNPMLPNAPNNESPMMMVYLFAIILFAIVMYLLRPSAIRSDNRGKPRFDGNSGGGDEQPVL